MSITEVSLGPFLLPVRLLIPIAAGVVSLLITRLVPVGRTDSRRRAVDLILGGVLVFIVLWKTTPLITQFSSVLRDPRVILFAPGGRPGVVVGIIGALLYGVRRLHRESAQVDQVKPLIGLCIALTVALTTSGFIAIDLLAPAGEIGNRGDVTQPLELESLSGAPVTIGGQRSRPLLLSFWATWCVPCRSETAVKNELAERYSGRIDVIGVNLTATETSIDDVAGFVRDWAVAYPVALDRTGRVAGEYAVRGTPTTVLIDRSGRIVGRYFGALSSAAADRLVAPVLRE